MITTTSWLIWLIASAALLVGEIFTATFFLLCFSVAALVASALSAFGLSTTVQWAGFALTSALSIGVSQKFAHKISKDPVRKANSERLIGKAGIVVETIREESATGRIRVGHEDWRAQCESGEVIEEGTRVKVTGLEGTHLLVEPSEQTQPESTGH